TITLATDGDYLRFLGESGFVGLATFLSIFLILGITLYASGKELTSPIIRFFVFGLVGGVVGLLVNAFFIDVFESSKVAETLWIFLGIGTGGMLLMVKNHIDYRSYLRSFFTSNAVIAIYLLIILM